MNVTLFLHPRRDDNVSPVRHSCAFELSLVLTPAEEKTAESSRPGKQCVCVRAWSVCDVCVTAEEAVGQQGRGIMTAPLVALLGLYRGLLINLDPAWPLAWLYLWPWTHCCTHTHTLYWQALLIQGQTHTHTHSDTDALCMHRQALKGTCVRADTIGIMNMHIYISMVIIMRKRRLLDAHTHTHTHICTHRNVHKQIADSIPSWLS